MADGMTTGLASKVSVELEVKIKDLQQKIATVNNELEKVGQTASKAGARMSDGVKTGVTKANKAVNNFKKELQRVSKVFLALFSLRTINLFLKRLIEVNINAEEFRAKLDGALATLSNAFTPVLAFVVDLLSKALSFAAGIAYQLFYGEQAMAKYNEDLAESIKKQKKLNAQLAGFDELNTLASTKDTSIPFTDMTEAVKKGMVFWKDWGWLILAIGAALATIKLASFISSLGLVAGAFKLVADIMWAIAKSPLLVNFLQSVFAGLSNIVSLLTGGTGLKTLLQGVFGTGSTYQIAAFLTVITSIIVAIIAIGAAIYNLWQNDIMGFQTKLTEFWNNILKGFNDAMIAMQPFFDFLVLAFAILWEGAIKPVWDAFTRFVGAIILGVVEILQAFSPLINFFVTYLLPVISKVFGAIIAAVAIVIAIISNVVGVIIQVFTFIVSFISGTIAGVIETVFNSINNFWKSIQLIWEGIKQIFSGDAKELLSGIGNMFYGIIMAFMTPILAFVNLVIDVINGVIKGVNSFKVPDWIPLIGGKSLNIGLISKISMPKMPELAQGGMLNAGQAFVAGEAGAELIGSYNSKTTVMPLENTSFVKAMADAVYGAMTTALNEGGNSQVVLQVDGMTLAKATEANLNKLSTVQGGLKIAF